MFGSGGSVQLARVFGIRIGASPSWFLVLFLMIYSLSGFFDEVLQRTEYFEPYIMEPLAEQMMAADPKLAAEFQHRLDADPAFRADPRQRLNFFYEHSPYFDQRWMLYPVARER